MKLFVQTLQWVLIMGVLFVTMATCASVMNAPANPPVIVGE